MTTRRKAEDTRKKENVNIPMTINQKTELEERAKKKGKYVSEYVRNILFPEQV